MAKVEFSRPTREVSCIAGNLFLYLEPPCDEELLDDFLVMRTRDGVVTRHHIGAGECVSVARIEGQTLSGAPGALEVEADRCTFYGNPEDLSAVLDGRCPARRCDHG